MHQTKHHDSPHSLAVFFELLEIISQSAQSKLMIPSDVQAGLTSMRSTAHSNQPMNRERKQVLAETVQNLEESQIEGDF